MTRSRPRRSLAAKLLAVQLLVILAGSATLLVVAIAIGPGIFRHHVKMALGVVPADVARHLDRAFSQATLISLGVAVAAAVLTALAVSWFVSLRVVRPIRALAAAAQRIASGSYGARVASDGSDELASLAAAFNEMAASLESAEGRRRELLANVAHELRTPLATVEGYVEGLADGVLPTDDETWHVLRAETRRLGRLVEDLQEVSRAEERQLEIRLAPTAPSALVATAIQASTPAYAAKGVTLEQQVRPRLPKVKVDPDRIGEVLANLLDNALRHTPAGGRVDVGAVRHGSNLQLTVTDSGDGIEREHLERIFERFYRADPARTRTRGGSGIGLTIARAIVEAHGGRLHAESAGVGHGARFVIELPLAPHSWPASADTRHSPSSD